MLEHPIGTDIMWFCLCLHADHNTPAFRGIKMQVDTSARESFHRPDWFLGRDSMGYSTSTGHYIAIKWFLKVKL